MKIHPYIILLLCLFNVSIYAQNTAQVTLTIRLYPIQTNKVEPSDIQMLVNSIQTLSKPTFLSQLSELCVSQYITDVNNESYRVFEVLCGTKDISRYVKETVDRIFYASKIGCKDDDNDDDEHYVVYCMDAM